MRCARNTTRHTNTIYAFYNDGHLTGQLLLWQQFGECGRGCFKNATQRRGARERKRFSCQEHFY